MDTLDGWISVYFKKRLSWSESHLKLVYSEQLVFGEVQNLNEDTGEDLSIIQGWIIVLSNLENPRISSIIHWFTRIQIHSKRTVVVSFTTPYYQFLENYLNHKSDRLIVKARLQEGDPEHASWDIGSEWADCHFCCILVAGASQQAILDLGRVGKQTPPLCGKTYKVIWQRA